MKGTNTVLMKDTITGKLYPISKQRQYSIIRKQVCRQMTRKEAIKYSKALAKKAKGK